MFISSVIVVTYNSGAHIEACLRALQKHSHWERIVVDNCSTDDTIERVRTLDPAARLVVNQENLGFGAAANHGARTSSGEVILFLNPDAIAQPGALDRIASALATDGVGAAGGALLGANGQTDVGFVVRRFPTVAVMMAEILLLNRLWPRNRLNRAYRCLHLDYTAPQDIEQPAGACLAVKREAWESVEGFDEEFFPVWFEDVDFCRRLRERGWKITYCPEAVFVHSGGHSVNRLPFRDRQIFWYRNLLRYFSKHHSRAAVAVLRVGIALGMAIRSVVTLLGLGPRDIGVGGALQSYAVVLWRYAFGWGKTTD